MWFFIAGAVFGVASLIAKNPVQFLQANHPIQGALVSAIFGAAVYGTIFWVFATLVF